MDDQVRDAIRVALSRAQYPVTVAEVRRAVRRVGVFDEAYLRGHLVDMEDGGEVERHHPHEKEFWHLVPPPWASVEAGGTA